MTSYYVKDFLPGFQDADTVYFDCDVVFNDGVTFEDTTFGGDTIIGDAGTDTLSLVALSTVSTDQKIQFRDTGIYLQSSADGTLDIVSDTIANITAPTITLTGATAINLDGDTTITGAMIMDSAVTTGFSITGATTTGIDIAGAATGILIDGLSGHAAGACINLNPTRTADSSMTPIRIAYDYDGSTTTGDIDLFSIRSTITQTGTNALTAGNRGYIQGMRSDVVTSGFTDVVYANYANVTCAGTTTSSEIYGMCSAVYLGAFEATVTHVAAIFGKVNGSGNVVGSGAADVVCASGLYLSWSSTNAMATGLTAGSHIAIEASSLCDSGYQVDAGGTLGTGFYVRNTAGTISSAMKVGGTVGVAFDFDDAVTCVDASATGYNTTCEGHILVKMADGGTAYVNCWSA